MSVRAQMEVLLTEATPSLVKHCVNRVAKRYGGDTERAFAICVSSMQKAGYLEPGSMQLTAKGKKKSAAHASEPDAEKKVKSYEKLLKKAKKTEAAMIAAAIGKKLKKESVEPECFTCEAADTPCPKCEEAGGLVYDDACDCWSCEACGWEGQNAPAGVKAVEDISEAKKTYAQAQADIIAGLEKDGWKVKKIGPNMKPMVVPHATSPMGDFKLFFKKQAIYMTHGDGDLGNARSLHLPDIRQGDYASFSQALGRWTGRDMKDQPLNKSGAAKPEPKFPGAQPGQAGFSFEPKQHHKDLAARVSLTPDQYHAKHGECPDGYHFDGTTKRCVKKESVDMDMRELRRLAGIDLYPDRKLETAGSRFDRREREAAGLAGAHADWSLHEESSKEEQEFAGFLQQLTKKYRGGWRKMSPSEKKELVALFREMPDASKEEWRREMGKDAAAFAREAEKRPDTPSEFQSTNTEVAADFATVFNLIKNEETEDRTDLWHPDRDVKNPGLPMNKPAPKAAAPADKGSALLKALKCPPGKEAKIVYGRPSCVPTAKS